MSVIGTPINDGTPSAQEMVNLLKTALRSSPATTVSVEVDGQKVQYSRSQAIEELKFWQREVAKEAGTRRRVRSINLGGSF